MTRLLSWTDRFSSHDLEGLLALYDRYAVFWGTSSQTLRDTPPLIRDCFTFTAMRNGQPDPRPARFSFTYRLRDGRWLIVDHPSSSVPAAPRQ